MHALYNDPLANYQSSPSRDSLRKIHIGDFKYFGSLREQPDRSAIYQTVLSRFGHDPVRLAPANVRFLHQHQTHAPAPAVFVEQQPRPWFWRDYQSTDWWRFETGPMDPHRTQRAVVCILWSGSGCDEDVPIVLQEHWSRTSYCINAYLSIFSGGEKWILV